jgi:DNA-binding PadR family transcriptional regulator
MPTATVDDVWLYIHQHNAVRTKDLEQEFVKTKRLSRGTLYKYKRLLEAEGKIQAKSVQGRPPYNVYFIPEKRRKHIEALKQFKQIPLKYFG